MLDAARLAKIREILAPAEGGGLMGGPALLLAARDLLAGYDDLQAKMAFLTGYLSGLVYRVDDPNAPALDSELRDLAAQVRSWAGLPADAPPPPCPPAQS